MSGMRTVSFFGPEEGGIKGGLTEADNGREAAGGFGGWKKLVDEISSGADCGEDETGGTLVSRTGNWIRTVSRGLTPGSGGFVTGGCGNSMRTVSFFGWSGSAISVGEIDQKSPTLSLANLASLEIALGQQIVAAASFNGPPNELANGRRLAQDDARIDIRSIAFASRDVRLIDEQFQVPANFLTSEVMGN
jgi:hypothetical protein